jgi:AcrR family transcriptional regulator
LSAVTEIPPPPWAPARGRSPRREPLDRDAIVDAALRVLDREGIDGLSMRRLAEELGTGPATLYWHVRNKDELLDLVLERVIGEFTPPPADPARWEEQLRKMAHSMRNVMRSHRDLARISLGRWPLGPNALRVLEWTLALARGAGLPDRDAARVGYLLPLYVMGFALDQDAEGPMPVEEGTTLDERIEEIRAYFASLADHFPNIAATADEIVGGDIDERFEYGLDVLLAGLASRAGGTGSRPPRRAGR